MRSLDRFPTNHSRWRERLNQAGFALLAAYVLAGIIYSVMLPPVARYTDESDYLILTHHLLHGPGYSMDGVHLTASRPPGYSFFIAPIEALGGGFTGVRIVHFLLLGASVLLVCRLWGEGELFAGPLIVTGLVALYPVLFYVAGTLYPQTLSAFLFLAALGLMLAEPGTIGRRFLAGLVFGVLILVVPTFLLTLFVLLPVAIAVRLLTWRDAAVVALAAALVVGSWTARNAVVFHRFVPVASNSGMNLLEGNNPGASPLEAAANAAMGPYFLQADALRLDEFQRDAYYKDAAVAWIRSHPGSALVLYLKKVLNFFNVVNSYSSSTQGEASTWRQATLAASYLLLMGLLAWRLAEARQHPLVAREKLFLAVYVLTAFTSAIFFTRIRHRLPFDFLIIAVVAPHLGRQLQHWLRGTETAVPSRG